MEHQDLDILAEHHRHGWADCSDAEHLAAVAAVIAQPRRDPADSFVLHAPLELAARAALLPFVAPSARDLARLRITALAVRYAAWEPAASVVPPASTDDADAAVARLGAAIAAGDPDDAQDAAGAVAATVPLRELRSRVGPVALPSLAAAAHAAILLFHLPRVAPRGELPVALLQPLARELARHPTWELEWLATPPTAVGSPGALAEALAAVPALGVPGSAFIYPLMHQVDGADGAAAAVGRAADGLAPEVAARVLLRAAAWSMLGEDDAHAPYGWSHCLTMPQAALGIASTLPEPAVGVRVATTYVVGFRAALGARPLSPWTPSSSEGAGVRVAVEESRDAAATAAWHAADAGRAAVVRDLATIASSANDAHLVKHTLACFDAAAADPAAAPLFLASAASLAAWWHAHGDPDDPIT